MKIRVSLRAIRRLLTSSVVLLSLAGLAVELARAMWPLQTFELPLGLISLSHEMNLPTWFSSHLILLCAVMLALVSRSDHPHVSAFRGHWRTLALIFVYLSIDEAIELHEGLNLVLDTSGFLYFGWVIPFGVAVIALGIGYLQFLRRLPAATRRLFCLAGGLYVGGALGVELILGAWVDVHGDENLTYALIDWVEESCEICGMSIFAWSLVNLLLSDEASLQVESA